MFPVNSRNLFNLYSLRRLRTVDRLCCFVHMKETSLSVLIVFLLVSSRNLLICSDSPENHPSIFPPLLTTLVFILFVDGGVPSIAQISEGTLQRKLRAEKKKNNRLFVKNNRLKSLLI